MDIVKASRLLFPVVVWLFASSVYSVTIGGNQPADVQAQSSDKRLRGEFISFNSGDRTLVSSVGDFRVPDAAQVIDHRSNQDAPAQVLIRYRSDTVVEVTIYQ